METENYLQIMTSSLEKKKKILQDIVDYNVEQEHIVTSGEFDGDKFQKNMENKAECIDMTGLKQMLRCISRTIRQIYRGCSSL